MPYHSWLACVRGCGRRYSIYDVVYRCEDCGGLLDVEHDLQALRGRSAAGWMRLFDRRIRTNEWPYGSGVWGKKEWVCPQVDNQNVVSMYEGHTNLFWAERLGREIGVPDLWVKLSGNSHTGSFKDLGMTVLVSVVRQMMANGRPIRAVAQGICQSCGQSGLLLFLHHPSRLRNAKRVRKGFGHVARSGRSSRARCYAKHATWSIIMVKLASEKTMVMRESRMQGQPARPLWRGLGRNGSQQWEDRALLPPYITYIRLRDEFVYLAVIMDVFTRSIRGWHLGRSLDQTLTLIALDRALAGHAPEIHHSDQGIQYAAAAYIEMLRAAGAEISMAEIGEAW